MKLYTCYTSSHYTLYSEYFLKSLNNLTNIELIAKELVQESETGDFLSTGFFNTMVKKVELIISACRENPNQLFIYADCDIQFFGDIVDPLIAELGDFDIACQNDVAPFRDRLTYCAGFFICRANDRVLNMFTEILKEMQLVNPLEYTDQNVLNEKLDMCSHKLLSNQFYTVSQSTNTVWNGQADFTIPNNLLMHHANWTVGVANKLKLLESVKEKYLILNS